MGYIESLLALCLGFLLLFMPGLWKLFGIIILGIPVFIWIYFFTDIFGKK